MNKNINIIAKNESKSKIPKNQIIINKSKIVTNKSQIVIIKSQIVNSILII